MKNLSDIIGDVKSYCVSGALGNTFSDAFPRRWFDTASDALHFARSMVGPTIPQVTIEATSSDGWAIRHLLHRPHKTDTGWRLCHVGGRFIRSFEAGELHP